MNRAYYNFKLLVSNTICLGTITAHILSQLRRQIPVRRNIQSRVSREEIHRTNMYLMNLNGPIEISA